MTEAETLAYEQTDADSIAVAHAALKYIYTGQTKGLPLGLRGNNVFAVVGMLREQEDTLDAEGVLTADQADRKDEIENDVMEALLTNAQYYPFGHNKDDERISLEGFVPLKSNWIASVRKASRSQALRVQRSR